MTGRRLGRDYSQWERQPEALVVRAVTTGLIVPDANVLLSLYELGASSRDEFFGLLDRVADQLWIPDQVAREYSRNRRGVVIGRVRQFSEATEGLREAPEKAARVIADALAAVSRLNQSTRSTQHWPPDHVGLGAVDLTKAIRELLVAGHAELDRLGAEHDIAPADIDPGDGDPRDHVFQRLDVLFTGRIGEPIGPETRRRLVEEAVRYRYPNDIPPGGADTEKRTDVDAAGDYLLWWQTLRKAGDRPENGAPGSVPGDSAPGAGTAGAGAPGRSAAAGAVPEHIVLITADAKGDWWVLNKDKKPLYPRPELAQEMLDRTGRRLVLLSVPEFIAVANAHLDVQLSAQTVTDLQHATETITDLAFSESFRTGPASLRDDNVLLIELSAAFRRRGFEFQRQVARRVTNGMVRIFAGSLSAERFGLHERVVVEMNGSGHRLRDAVLRTFQHAVFDGPAGREMPGRLEPRRAIVVSVAGFDPEDGPWAEDDRIYLMGPGEINRLLDGVAALPVLAWLLRDVPGIDDLDG